MENKYIKTEILLGNDGKEFDTGSLRKIDCYIKTLPKEDALKLFDEGMRVYFIYENNRTYRKNCRKVCKDRNYLIDHYDAYHELCGVAIKTVELCTFPVADEEYCLSFLVPQKWCSEHLRKAKYSSSDNLKRFLDTYIWDETYFIYESAREECMILEETRVH